MHKYGFEQFRIATDIERSFYSLRSSVALLGRSALACADMFRPNRILSEIKVARSVLDKLEADCMTLSVEQRKERAITKATASNLLQDLNPHLNHQLMIGTAYINNPPTTVEQANGWLKSLIKKIGMEVLMGPFTVDCVTEGNEGITGIVVMSTSHASFHCWHLVERPFLTFDVYSCRSLDPQIVLDHFAEFEPNKIDWVMMDRNEANIETGRDTHIP